jgi:16S rRNA (guanine527-N7)-methyltransferase
VRPAVLAVLEEAQAAGFLGPGPVADHVEHARGVAAAVASPPARALDLGSGGGVPGLVLAEVWPASRWVLLDRGAKRCAFLRRAVAGLGLAARVAVEEGAAESLGTDAAWRGRFDLVVSRSFGPPAVTAECAAPFLRVDGLLAVAEPPRGHDRWPAAEVARLGLAPGELSVHAAATVQVLRQAEPCPPEYPRRAGIPAKRPLW